MEIGQSQAYSPLFHKRISQVHVKLILCRMRPLQGSGPILVEAMLRPAKTSHVSVVLTNQSNCYASIPDGHREGTTIEEGEGFK